MTDFIGIGIAYQHYGEGVDNFTGILPCNYLLIPLFS
jgi:hypothetical protein